MITHELFFTLEEYLNILKIILKKAVELAKNLENYTMVFIKDTKEFSYSKYFQPLLYKWDSDVVALYIEHWGYKKEKITNVIIEDGVILTSIEIYFSIHHKRMLVDPNITTYITSRGEPNYLKTLFKIKKIIEDRILQIFPDFKMYEINLKNICTYFCWSKNHCKNFLKYCLSENSETKRCDITNQKRIPLSEIEDGTIKINNWRPLEKYLNKKEVKVL